MTKSNQYQIKKLTFIGLGFLVLFIVSSCDSNSNSSTTDSKEFYQNTPPEDAKTIDVNKFTGQKFTFKSTLNDKEENGEIVQTNHETTYHTFDFINNTVTMKSPLHGEWVTITYPVNGFYAQEGLAATTFVLVVGQLGVKEIWFSPDVQNLGYDYEDGSRIACYELSNVK